MTTNYMEEANRIAAQLRQQADPTSKAARRVAKTATASRCRLPVSPTKRQMEVLEYMRVFFAANDQLPPVAQIAKHFGWSSPSAATEPINALMRHGLIERNAVGKLRFARKEVAHG